MKSIERLLMLLLVGLLTACGAKEKGTDLPLYQSLDDLKGKKVAVMTGSFHEGIIEKRFPEVEAMRIDYAADLARLMHAPHPRHPEIGFTPSQMISVSIPSARSSFSTSFSAV